MNINIHNGGYTEFMSAELTEDVIAVLWLGQAGFILRMSAAVILIDPYLSDHLAEKYRNAELKHRRMMQPPVEVDELLEVDWVLCSHRHGDHLDPIALPRLAGRFSQCRFVVPAAERQSALDVGLPEERIVCIDTGESLSLSGDMALKAIPSAHETLKQDAAGRHHFLGYILKHGDTVIYHSGDCVPYDGMEDMLREESIDVAMLPVNGRDDYRRERGVPGNMDFAEAAALCRAVRIPQMIAHHFGMFEFNTIDEKVLCEQAKLLPPGLQCHIPEIGKFVTIGPG